MSSLQEQLEEIKNEEKQFKEASPKLTRFQNIVFGVNVTVVLLLMVVAIVISTRLWLESANSDRSVGLLIWHIIGTMYFSAFAIGFIMSIVSEVTRSILQYLYKVPSLKYNQFVSAIETFEKRKKYAREYTSEKREKSKSIKTAPTKESEKSTEIQTPRKDELVSKPSNIFKNRSTSKNDTTTYTPQSIKPKPYIPVGKQEEKSKTVEIPKSTEKKTILAPESKQTSEIKIVPTIPKTIVSNTNKEKPIPKEEEKTSSELFDTSGIEVVKQESAKIHQPKTPVKIDFSKLNEHRHNIGELGEQYIFEKEQNYFIMQGKIDQSKEVNHVSLKSDSEGYDIISFTDTGERKYIEVKTTTGKEFEPFYLSNSEMEAMKRLNNYWIYRVYNFNVDLKKGDLYKIDCSKELDSYYYIQASSFKVTPKH